MRPASVSLKKLMYDWRWLLKYFSSSYSRSCCFRMSSVFTILRHCSTWDACFWIHLGTSSAAALGDSGAACVGWVGISDLCPVNVQYVDLCLVSPRKPCCHPPSSNCIVGVLSWILWWTSWMILQSTKPLKCCNFLEGGSSVNVFRFGCHSCFWFHQFWWTEMCRGSL